jgi:hypothetical protein
VYIRAAVETGRHAVWYVDAVEAPPAEPPGWQPLVWEYDTVTFVAAQVPSRALAFALDRDDAQVLSLGRYDLTFPVCRGNPVPDHCREPAMLSLRFCAGRVTALRRSECREARHEATQCY